MYKHYSFRLHNCSSTHARQPASARDMAGTYHTTPHHITMLYRRSHRPSLSGGLYLTLAFPVSAYSVVQRRSTCRRIVFYRDVARMVEGVRLGGLCEQKHRTELELVPYKTLGIISIFVVRICNRNSWSLHASTRCTFAALLY